MADSSVAKRLVEAIIANLPAPVPGKRPVHTIGMGVKGEFVASDVARTYCIAEHFKREPIPVSVRFSNGLGGPEQHDGWSDVRGMATRFHLPDGTATDLIATTLGEFFVRNVEDFFEFAEGRKARAVSKAIPVAEDLGHAAAQASSSRPVPERNRECQCGSTPLRQSAPVRSVGSCPGRGDRRSAELCPRELSRRPHLHGDRSQWSSPPRSLFLAAGRRRSQYRSQGRAAR